MTNEDRIRLLKEQDEELSQNALKTKRPLGTLACPTCGTVCHGAIDEICQWCEQPYWRKNETEHIDTR